MAFGGDGQTVHFFASLFLHLEIKNHSYATKNANSLDDSSTNIVLDWSRHISMWVCV